MSTSAASPLLSVVIPVLNEAPTLVSLLERVQQEPTPKEIVVVDDGSSDTSAALAERFAAAQANVKVLRHASRQGKGSALRTGFAACAGRYVIVQDADLEYDPGEYRRLLEVVESGRAEAAYGSREKLWPAMTPLQRLANSTLTVACNLLYGARLTDIMTCYKLLPVERLRALPLESSRFEIECEITAKVLKRGWRIEEVPINYSPRTREQGKKIRWKDGFRSLWALLKYRLRD